MSMQDVPRTKDYSSCDDNDDNSSQDNSSVARCDKTAGPDLHALFVQHPVQMWQGRTTPGCGSWGAQRCLRIESAGCWT